MSASKPARVIVTDPPWRFGDALPPSTHGGRGADRHYPTMTVDEIIANVPRPPGGIAWDATLCLWRVAAMQAEALAVVAAWQFVVVSELVWVKTTADLEGDAFGMGRTVRNCHEVMLICRRGRGAPVLSHSERSVLRAPVGRHSAKPDASYDLIGRLFGGPYHEQYARRRRPGWSCEGNQVPEGIEP